LIVFVNAISNGRRWVRLHGIISESARGIIGHFQEFRMGLVALRVFENIPGISSGRRDDGTVIGAAIEVCTNVFSCQRITTHQADASTNTQDPTKHCRVFFFCYRIYHL